MEAEYRKDWNGFQGLWPGGFDKDPFNSAASESRGTFLDAVVNGTGVKKNVRAPNPFALSPESWCRYAEQEIFESSYVAEIGCQLDSKSCPHSLEHFLSLRILVGYNSQRRLGAAGRKKISEAKKAWWAKQKQTLAGSKKAK